MGAREPGLQAPSNLTGFKINIAKGTTDPRVGFILSTSWGHITSSNTNLDQIHLQNLDLASTSQLNISISNKLKILTKIQLHNLYRTSSAKCWTNSSFEILPKLQLQNLDQPLCSKSERKFSFMTKRQLLNQQAVANIILNISNTNNLNKFWVGIFTRQGHINQVYQTGVSQSVSELVTRVNNDRTWVR